MKKLILKTALITFWTAVACGAVLLLILDLAAPKFMMDFTGSLGMKSVSANYAYDEYERSGDPAYLARAFLILENNGEDKKALVRWEELYESEGFGAYCETGAPEGEDLPAYSYRDYLTGCAARLKYRLSGSSAAGKTAALTFALSETKPTFPQGNPVIALSAEAMKKEDGAFLGEIYGALSDPIFERNAEYTRLMKQLEGYVHA